MPFSALAFVSYPRLAAMISPFGALKVEPELASVVLADLELGRHHISSGSSGAWEEPR
jgi:hypothetical protein